MTRYVPGPAIDEPIAMVTSGGTKTYFHTNHQGSVIAMSGTSAALAEGPYTYDPYGNCFSGSSPCSSGEPYRFTGQRFDAESGLLDYRARYYSPFLGRFMQTDPVGYDADLNLYSYAENDPVGATDPTGEACVPANALSDYCRRAVMYSRFDAKFSAQTRFFAAASMTTTMLADQALFPVGQMLVSASTRQNMANISGQLEQMNIQVAKSLENGSLSGAHLDEALVNKEQTAVQGYLNNLAQSDPGGYASLISEVNGLLNPHGMEAAGASLYPSDRSYQAVLDSVRIQLGRDIDFSKQKDREAIGDALIDKIRSSGECTRTGSRIPQC